MSQVILYLNLCKLRVVLLMVITTIVGMCLAPHHTITWQLWLSAPLGIALSACSAAAFNHLIDNHLDRVMQRTQQRPLVTQSLQAQQVIIFASALGALSLTLLCWQVNYLTAALTFCSMIGYTLVYTAFLKYQTTQNIVIGGAAGAAPPLLGWVSVTGAVQAGALLLMAIIFVWTPPHFWALSINRFDDYAKTGLPMLANRFGIAYTIFCIFIYTILLSVITILPYSIGLAGTYYLLTAMLLNAIYLALNSRIFFSKQPDKPALTSFWYSIIYLFVLFIALLADHPTLA